jgi:hypothetical protein
MLMVECYFGWGTSGVVGIGRINTRLLSALPQKSEATVVPNFSSEIFRNRPCLCGVFRDRLTILIL